MTKIGNRWLTQQTGIGIVSSFCHSEKQSDEESAEV
jgi:hypothetical protein